MTQAVGRALAIEALPEGSEGKGQSYMTMAFHSGFFIEPPLGGFIVEYVSWRGVFFLLVPIGLACMTLCLMGRRKVIETEKKDGPRSIDSQGALLLIAVTVVFTLLLDRRAGEFFGINHRGVLRLILAGVVGRFLVHENRVSSPIINLSLFRIRMFAFSLISLIALFITRGLVGFLLPFYIQGILFIPPSLMEIMYLTSPVFTLSLAPLVGSLTDRIGPRIPASLGVLFSILVLVVGILLRKDSHWLLPTLMLSLTGVATAFFNSANLAAMIGSVPKEDRGFASGMVHSAFDLGHMLGVSLGGLFLSLAFQYYLGVADAVPNPENPLAYVSAVNITHGVAPSLALVALSFSMSRGSGRIEAAQVGAH